jgi:hypothetical protein
VNLYYSQDHGATWSISQGDGLGSSNVSLAQQEGAIRGFAWNGAQWLATGAQALATGQLFGTGYILMTSTEGITWTIVPSLYQANSNLILSGQKVGWSLNTTPALLTNHFSIVDQPLGYIPITSLSTNVLQVTPKGLHFNDSLTVLNAQSNTQKGRVGIHTTNPQYSLDIQGDWIVQNSTSFTTVWANLPNSNATTGFTNATAGVLGSTYMTSVVIHTANTGVARQVPLDIDLAGYPGLIRDNIRDNSAINSTIVQLTNTSVLPATDSGTPSRLWWQWINGTSQSTIGYAITGSVVPFTGQHAVDISGVSYDSLSQYVGLCVRSADRGYITKTLQGQTITGVSSIQSTEALPICEITRIAKDKAVFGVISDYENVPSAYDMSLISPYANRDALLQGRIRVNGLGDGAIWVTDEGGPIQVGDYLCTSEIVGHVKRQENPNTQYNYTVAKATMSCDFQLSQTQYRCETLTWNGQERKRAYLGCTYHCG